MTKAIRIGEVSIPLDSYVVGGTALLGIRESGKSFAAKGIAEQLLDHDIPIVVFDAIGVWRFLKVARPSSGGRGFKVVVAGGEGADLPLTPASAPAIVRAAIVENIPLVIDLYDPKLSKADWRRIVQHCFRTLLYENKGLRHIFLEETAEYAPQKVMDGETYAEVEKLVRMGGNKSLGITLINQRAQEVNKAVLDLCENLVLMRQRGAHAIEALEKWIDKLEPDVAKQIAAEMPRMGQGDAWVFSGSADAAKRTHTALIHSYHPDRRKPQTRETSPDRIADTADFVAKLAGELKTLTAQAEANDPKMLKKRIADLEQQLRAKPGAAPTISREDLKAAEARGFAAGHTAYAREAAKAAVAHLRTAKAELHKAVESILRTPVTMPEVSAASSLNTRATPAPVATSAAKPQRQPAPAPRISGSNGSSHLSKAARKILAVLSQYPEGCAAGKLTLLTGYRYSGSFQNALSELRTAGCLQGENTGVMTITAEGEAQGPFPTLPQGDELVHYWLNHSSLSKAARLILENLKDGDERTADQLCESTGYSYSGSFQNALSELRTAGVLVGKNTERMRISPEIVP